MGGILQHRTTVSRLVIVLIRPIHQLNPLFKPSTTPLQLKNFHDRER